MLFVSRAAVVLSQHLIVAYHPEQNAVSAAINPS
jgi:hypothetical protein